MEDPLSPVNSFPLRSNSHRWLLFARHLHSARAASVPRPLWAKSKESSRGWLRTTSRIALPPSSPSLLRRMLRRHRATLLRSARASARPPSVWICNDPNSVDPLMHACTPNVNTVSSFSGNSVDTLMEHYTFSSIILGTAAREPVAPRLCAGLCIETTLPRELVAVERPG